MHAYYMQYQQQQQWQAAQQAIKQQRHHHHQQLRQSIRELRQSTLRDVLRDRNAAMMNQLQDIQHHLHKHDEQQSQAAMTELLQQILHQQKKAEEEPANAPNVPQQADARGAAINPSQPPPRQAAKRTSAIPATSKSLDPAEGTAAAAPWTGGPPKRPPTAGAAAAPVERSQAGPHNATPHHDRGGKEEVMPVTGGALFSEDEEQLLAIPEDDYDTNDILADPPPPSQGKEDVAAQVTVTIQESKRHDSMRRKALMQHMNHSTTGLKRPQWRLDADAANGVVSTFGEGAMAPVQVFRSVAMVVLSVVCLQRLSLARRKTLRDEEAQVMANMIQVYVEATRSWMAKEVRVPIASVLQDPTMNFGGGGGGADKGLKKKYKTLLFPKKVPKNTPQALVQLKVRLKGIVDAIVKTTLRPQDTPDAIAKFLRRVTTDGVYFPPDYLSAEERTALEFNSLGATRNMTMNPHRFNVVVLNFVVVRIVVPDLILRPWEGGIGSKVQPAAQVQHNLRVLATAMYTLCQQIVPTALLDPGTAAPAVVSSEPPPQAQSSTMRLLTQIPALLYPKDVLPLHDVDFAAFLIDQQEKLQTWLHQLQLVVHTQPPGKPTTTNEYHN
ncbi:hypothetical protein, variant 2 [Aphanomyces astaci]|uniref:Uncharacterized protein n=1 Tax=Aphanomyces astaci TaxID=112090 RepID=W4FQP7_APHAT|nr:hypothetical protein, variant 2 [Aphanomyces astaci]ETV69119.1 hypothetical protein, variant 2 [Aphanomyces astaci]|eukprot:XP_009841371.1 hypothetical protein, variant 2 [Aphanomyces astaci]